MLVRASFSLIVPLQDAIATRFYDRLFETAPELRSLFPHDLGEQKRKLISLLGTCIGRLHDFSALAPRIRELGARHGRYGATRHHYAIVAEALCFALALGLGVAFNAKLRSAWVKVYDLLAKTMQAGADAAELGASSSRSLPKDLLRKAAKKHPLSCTRFRRHRVRCFMEQEVRHGEKAVYAGVQA